MRMLLMALAALSLMVASSTGCASDKAQEAPTVTAPPPAPVYPSPCPKLRNCLNAYKAQMPAMAAEFEEAWTGVKGAYSQSPQNAAKRCAMSLRGYAIKSGAPPSCR